MRGQCSVKAAARPTVFRRAAARRTGRSGKRFTTPSRAGSSIAVVLALAFALACEQAGAPQETTSVVTATPDRPSATAVVATPAPTPLTYVVQPGDFLSAIAERFNTTVRELVEANDIADPTLIEVGQVLLIPGQTTAPAEISTPPEATQAGAESAATAPAEAAPETVATTSQASEPRDAIPERAIVGAIVVVVALIVVPITIYILASLLYVVRRAIALRVARYRYRRRHRLAADDPRSILRRLAPGQEAEQTVREDRDYQAEHRRGPSPLLRRPAAGFARMAAALGRLAAAAFRAVARLGARSAISLARFARRGVSFSAASARRA